MKWRSLDELAKNGRSEPARSDEFSPEAAKPPEPPEGDVSRRRFLSLMGASAALAAASGCERPGAEPELVSYANQPEGTVPGVASYYATSWQEGTSVYPLLAKTREGRPIHLQGNDLHPHSRGKSSLRAQAQILSLYDPDRLRHSTSSGKPVQPGLAAEELVSALVVIQREVRPVLLLTQAILSRSQMAVIERMRQAITGLRHVAWEPLSDETGRAAWKSCYGMAAQPRARMDRARVVLALEDDFLGCEQTDPTLVGDFAERRRVSSRNGSMSQLIVAEGRMSLTGSNADERMAVKPSQAAAFAFALAGELHRKHSLPLPAGVDAAWLQPFDLRELCIRLSLDHAAAANAVDALAKASGHALVMAGQALPAPAHVAANLLNEMLGAAGAVLEGSDTRPAPELASASEMKTLASNLRSGQYGAAIFWETNPCYSAPNPEEWTEALSKCTSVTLTSVATETSEHSSLVLATNHWLESWGDYEVSANVHTLQQPALAPLHDTLQAEDHLLQALSKLTGEKTPSYRELVRERWRSEVQPSGSLIAFDTFWNAALHDGSVEKRNEAVAAPALNAVAVKEAASAAEQPVSGMELVLHGDSRIYDGRHADNGWLQELPEPVHKTVWGNSLAISVADAEKMGIHDGDQLVLEASGKRVELPALLQPGQAQGVVSAALGYGKRVGNVGGGVGASLYPLIADSSRVIPDANVKNTGVRGKLVRTQDHHSMEGRDLARSLSLDKYHQHGPPHGAHHPEGDLYPAQDYPDHKWGMVIDLNSCTGCSGCVMACQSENNVPIVGPDDVERGREMHWIRLDRYYDEPKPGRLEVVHLPMLCQHCDSAPCENVCPVNATTQSPEGLNQMAYNRCVGTRYCANNCPYKVRRFNFFDYQGAVQEPAELVFNPEVSIRPRGVMEKCTFCVQRIQNAKEEAKQDERALKDGEVKPACAVACPTEAIVFGDLKNPESRVSKLWSNDRGYRILQAELGVKPSIVYLAKLRNTPDESTDPEKTGGTHES